MYFVEVVKRLIIDIFFFAALVINLFFMYFQMSSFVRAAVSLNMLNVQIISYTLYAVLLLVLPVLLLSVPQRFSKRHALKGIFYAFAAVLIIGTCGDLIAYGGFVGYQFSEGDAVFVNLMWNMPNIFGVLCSAVMAVLYIVLGNKIARVRRGAYVMFLLIAVFTIVIPFAYSLIIGGSMPRQTWLEKSAFIIPEFICLLTSFSVAVSSRKLWTQHIW